MKFMNKVMFVLIATCSMTMQAQWYEKPINQGIAVICALGFGTWVCSESNESLIEKADAELQNLDTCQDLVEDQLDQNKTQEQKFQEYLQKKFQVQTSQIKKGTNANSRLLHTHIDRMRSKLSNAKKHLEFRQKWVSGLFASSIHAKYSEIKRLQDALNRADSYKAKSLEQFLLGHQIVNEHKELLPLLNNKVQFVGSVYRKYFTQSHSPLKAYMNQIVSDIDGIDQLLQGSNYREEFPELRKKLEDSRKNLVNAFDIIQASKEYKEEQNAQFKIDQAAREDAKVRALQLEAQTKAETERAKARAAEKEADAKVKDADTNRMRLRDEQNQRDQERQDQAERDHQADENRRNNNPPRNGGQRNIPVAHARPVN